VTPEKIRRIVRVLRRRYDVRPKKYDAFYVLMHVMLASRTTDEVSWPAAERLIARGKNARGISRMSAREIERIILPANFYKTKARHIRLACKMLVEKFGGKVPRTREELMELPGVGGKSADIVLSFSYGKPVIAVDAHVKWVSHALKISREKNPEKIRARLHEIFPEKDRLIVNDLFVQFGKEICNTGRPKCWMCPVVNMCPYENKRLVTTTTRSSKFI
jgi:endonuclease-3